MINKDFLARKKEFKEIKDIKELKGCYLKKATVKDIKAINKVEGDIEQAVELVSRLVVDIDGKEAFTQEEINEFEIAMFKQVSEKLNELLGNV